MTREADADAGEMRNSIPLAIATRHRRDELDRIQEFHCVYQSTLSRVLGYLLAHVGNPVVAEDLAAEVFEQAFRSWPGFRGDSTASTWILGITRHVLKHHWRGKVLQTVPFTGYISRTLVDSDETPEQAVERSERADVLWHVIADLPPGERDLLALRYGANLPFEDVAQVLGIRAGTARVRMHRILGRIRERLEDDR